MEVGLFSLYYYYCTQTFLFCLNRKWGKRNRAKLGFSVFGDHMQRLPLNTLFSLVAIDFVEKEEMEKD